jgi:hypothetical protein
MAEGLAIIGLASNIVSFIDFGTKVVSANKAIRDSAHGTLPEVRQLDLIVEDIRYSNIQCHQQLSNTLKLSKEEKNMLAMTGECDRLVTDMQRKLDRLKIREGPIWKVGERLRILLAATMGGSDIEALRRQLESLDERIRASLRDILGVCVHTNYGNDIGS